MLRHKELVTKYDIDLLWFDGYGFPYNEYGKEVCKTFFNHKLNKNGNINAVVAGKHNNEPSIVKDIERGGADTILPYPWQGITTPRTWFYKEDDHRIEYRHNARTIIELLVDYNSKNGNLLLNVELLPDGTIPPEQKILLNEVGDWINLNQEAIYASKPWKIYGDNLNSITKKLELEAVTEADLEALKIHKKSGHYNERTTKSPEYGHEEVRYTTKDGVLYIFVLNPKEGEIKLPSLGLKSKYCSKKISSIKMIGINSKIKFKQDAEALTLFIPNKRPNKYATVFKIEIP